MKNVALRRRMDAVVLLLIGLVSAGTLVLGSASAEAAMPSESAAADFAAPLCPGQTLVDPRHSSGPVSDLTLVFGARLADVDAGKVAVLYDGYGTNRLDAYPPVCGTRLVEGIGPVSEWMFCTDIWSHVCAGTDSAGNLLNFDGAPIPGLDPKTGNPRLDVPQEKLVSWLIVNGHSYTGTGYYDFGVTSAIQDGTSEQRSALQTLVWCISDPADPADVRPTERERAQTCADSMSAAEQTRLLAQLADDPAVTIDFDGPGDPLATGQTAPLTLTTNLYGQPITIDITGLEGALSVINGPAEFDAMTRTLIVTGSDPAVSTTVTLGFTPLHEGNASVEASAQPVSRTHIAWNQSPGLSAGNRPCQVFATFISTAERTVSDTAQARFVEVPASTAPAEPSPVSTASGEGRTGLAPTGIELPILSVVASGLLIAAGIVMLALRRRRVAE